MRKHVWNNSCFLQVKNVLPYFIQQIAPPFPMNKTPSMARPIFENPTNKFLLLVSNYDRSKVCLLKFGQEQVFFQTVSNILAHNNVSR